MAQRPISSMYGARRILDLKESGINVQDEWVEVPSDEKVKKYFLTEMDIKKIKRKLNADSSS